MTRRSIPGTGDAYTFVGGRLVVVPASAPLAQPQAAPPTSASTIPGDLPALVPDPVLERERAMLGGFIVGDVAWSEAATIMAHEDHRRILDAMAGEYVATLTVAIQLCQAAGLPPELCGAVLGDEAMGYLVGCVRSWRASVEAAKGSEPPPAWDPRQGRE